MGLTAYFFFKIIQELGIFGFFGIGRNPKSSWAWKMLKTSKDSLHNVFTSMPVCLCVRDITEFGQPYYLSLQSETVAKLIMQDKVSLRRGPMELEVFPHRTLFLMLCTPI